MLPRRYIMRLNELLPYLRLHLNIKYPSYESCYAEGYKSGAEGENETSNPYPEKKPEHEQWLEGWWDGFYGEPPLFELPLDVQEKHENLEAANAPNYQGFNFQLFTEVLKVTSIIVGTAVMAYQIIDLVA